MTKTMSPVEAVILRFQRGLYETVEEAVGSFLLTTDEEREEVRAALKDEE